MFFENVIPDMWAVINILIHNVISDHIDVPTVSTQKNMSLFFYNSKASWNSNIYFYSRPGRSQWLLYRHRRHWFTDSWFVETSLQRLHALVVKDGAFSHNIFSLSFYFGFGHKTPEGLEKLRKKTRLKHLNEFFL